jgi:hypothetical protein
MLASFDVVLTLGLASSYQSVVQVQKHRLLTCAAQ